MRLAKSLRSAMPAVKLHQYVCPQVWAWKKGRIPELGRVLDTLYCLFDFEPDLFRGLPVEAIWVGNPLVETVKPEVDHKTFFSSTDLDSTKPLVALLPGSRKGEIQRLLPPMTELARRWHGDPKHHDVQWVLPVAPTLSDEFISPFLNNTPILPLRSYSYAARAYSDAALVASGTATLETALLGTPFAIVYKLNPLTYAMAKSFVKLPYFGLANVVAGRGVVEELVQGQVNPDELSKVLARLLDPVTSAKIRADLGTVRQHLGEPGAAARVAEHLLHSMENA
ncbi:MAG: lipid-A-disaccharide synthase [Holophagaceae bacterium]|nr:lipid-A-disaccharide synthase [Holophagaceae bacterium]